jgi:osmotically-inducible protein OsmY
MEGEAMFRTLVRLVLIVVILVAIGAFFFGYQWAADEPEVRTDAPVGTTGEPAIDTSEARETGAEIGEKVAVGAAEAQEALSEAALTAKIKSKMALDDTIDAADIDVDTNGTVVTLSGRVGSDAERTRALQLAQETDGVTRVVDQLSR